MRSKFDEQLALLNRDLTKMGSLCEEALALAAKALANADGQTAAKIAPIDSEIDQMERTIESLCLKLLLQQQPVARDLRQISAALKMITDMERIGDQASDIAEIIGFLNGRIGLDAQYICQMAVAAMRMVTESVEAYVKRDVAMAEATIQHLQHAAGKGPQPFLSFRMQPHLLQQCTCSCISLFGRKPF